MARRKELSRLQIMCQYQISALFAGTPPGVVFSKAYVWGCQEAYAQNSALSEEVREHSSASSGEARKVRAEIMKGEGGFRGYQLW